MSKNKGKFWNSGAVNDMAGVSSTTEYIKWSSMLKRCYDTAWIEKYRPTYIGASVCERWLTFSNYYNDYQTGYFTGAVLDKDILFYGNKHYSPETCVWVPEFVNLLVVCNPSENHLFGVTANKNSYSSSITITGETVTLGKKFPTELDAHREWQSVKGQHFVCAAEDYKNKYKDNFDQRVYDQLVLKAEIILLDLQNNRPTLRY
ncbi:TPA: hypothetical protein ACPZF7_000239 [Yersinia enterocolitica]|uniref:hypothetical protein n=1 Tax=Yersinia enterocolitica TaxID=630 RepID=UPI002AC75038|nr:hypothetical protein [Yersinia enterocolitica]HDL7631646.1 hypothetical protein [Yersinia enterocolitica]HDL8307920.1 hypothetical protein [Yersinia enterocolitica]HEN3595626.1 hypothetical protein [Yersinia enterocolitica]